MDRVFRKTIKLGPAQLKQICKKKKYHSLQSNNSRKFRLYSVQCAFASCFGCSLYHKAENKNELFCSFLVLPVAVSRESLSDTAGD